MNPFVIPAEPDAFQLMLTGMVILGIYGLGRRFQRARREELSTPAMQPVIPIDLDTHEEDRQRRAA